MSKETQGAMAQDMIVLTLILSDEHTTTLRQMCEQFANEPTFSPYLHEFWNVLQRQVNNNIEQRTL